MRKLPQYITLDEFNKLIDHIEKVKPPRYKEYLIAIILAFKAGMRISEIVGYDRKQGDKIQALTSDKIDIQQHSIRIVDAKFNKDRVVPLPKEINEKALKLLPLNINRRSLEWFIKKYGKEAIGKDLKFHSLRHGFGSHLASGGRPIHEIQMLMGHSRMDTTGIYLHANPKQAIDGARDLF